MTTLVKVPLWEQLCSVLMDQCNVREDFFFFLKNRLLCEAVETVLTPPWLFCLYFLFFFLHSPLRRAGVSWRAADSQSSAQMLLGECGGRGERDVDGCYWNTFSYWPEKLDHIVCHREKCPIKTCQYGPSTTRQMFTCVSWAYRWAGVCADGLTCSNAGGICSTGIWGQQCKYHQKKKKKKGFLFDHEHMPCKTKVWHKQFCTLHLSLKW